MGLQFRKRTKGKNSWINVSHSKKNGLSASLSVKLDKNLTMNFGGKGNRRATINFGNGIRYVKYRTPKGRTKSESRSTNSKSSSYRSYEPRPSKQEMLCSIQQVLLNIRNSEFITNSADAQVVLDLYDAIEIIKSDPDSQENRDLILVTTNQYKELVATINDQHLIDHANNICGFLKMVLPYHYYDKFFSEKIEKLDRQRKIKIWGWGSIIGMCLLIAMCSA